MNISTLVSLFSPQNNCLLNKGETRLSLPQMPITGNVDSATKELFSDVTQIFGLNRSEKPGFGDSVARGLVVVHASVDNKAEEPLKQEGRVVCELTVTEEMLNGGGNIHGGCSAFLIDMCSTLSIMALTSKMNHVSQSLNIVYHSPATLGEKLRIVNTTMTVGARAMSARTEACNRIVLRESMLTEYVLADLERYQAPFGRVRGAY
ncbi:Acyl-coenzyme A thioesterase 13 [Mycena sanguinolenta]|uniref:Acyl-coenzyme A thioesterase 13 n=1 Tax=Mycena sanguinolenta TaxID=230812 RepID=A0A8H6ZCX6_9AGAR|nr:Acyl-coenzyme A thioesterase 13 [Mycena sanguinolenta]